MHVSTGAGINPRFHGQWFQAENELHQNWMRDYDPTLGRYLQADPQGLADGPSVYGYALQNPQRYLDPRGENAGVFEPDGGVSQPGDYGGQSVAGGGTIVGVGGRILGGAIALIVTPNAAADGELPLTPTFENGACGGPCEYLEKLVDSLKTRNESLGSCKGGMSPTQLADRYNVFRKLAFKRQERDQICHGASDAGHMDAIKKALNRMRKCARLLKL